MSDSGSLVKAMAWPSGRSTTDTSTPKPGPTDTSGRGWPQRLRMNSSNRCLSIFPMVLPLIDVVEFYIQPKKITNRHTPLLDREPGGQAGAGPCNGISPARERPMDDVHKFFGSIERCGYVEWIFAEQLLNPAT